MPKTAHRYEIYLPLTYNDGRPIEPKIFYATEKQLTARFGGFTALQRDFPLRGVWQHENESYKDEIVIYTMYDFRPRGSTRFINQLKKQLHRDFAQIEILITEIALRVH